MFRVKICGVTRAEDAESAVAAGADAIGLNFYAESKRCVDRATAASLSAVIDRRAIVVGVFVNATAHQIEQTVKECELHAVQLHGDEPPGFTGELPASLPIIRAHRCGAEGLQTLAEWIAVSQTAGRPIAAALVDAPAPTGVYGGTGHQADWRLLADRGDAIAGTPIILAGGLRPENVADAVGLVRPDGVDTASGVESAPGIKDAALMQSFVGEALKALSAK